MAFRTSSSLLKTNRRTTRELSLSQTELFSGRPYRTTTTAANQPTLEVETGNARTARGQRAGVRLLDGLVVEFGEPPARQYYHPWRQG